MKPVNMPPDAPTLMWSTRAIGYTTPAAVADLIDNSVSANASNINIQFMSGENSYVSILDDGCGMSPENLRMVIHVIQKKTLKDSNNAQMSGTFLTGGKESFLQMRLWAIPSK